MHKRLVGMLITSAALFAAGCQDPGCIRHSQCKSGYECRDSKCQLPESAAAKGGASGASKASGGTPSVARVGTGGTGVSGTLSTIAGSSGQSAAVNPDAGMSM